MIRTLLATVVVVLALTGCGDSSNPAKAPGSTAGSRPQPNAQTTPPTGPSATTPKAPVLRKPKTWPEDPAAAVKATYRLAWRALYHGDGELACSLMTDKYRAKITEELVLTEYAGETCPELMKSSSEGFKIGLKNDKVKITKLSIDGRHATFVATGYTDEKERGVTIKMSLTDDQWLISGDVKPKS